MSLKNRVKMTGTVLNGVNKKAKKECSFMLPWLIIKFAGLVGATATIVCGLVVLFTTPISVYWVLGLALVSMAIPMLILLITEEVPNIPKGQCTILHNENIRNATAYNSRAYIEILDIIEKTHSKQNPEARYIKMLDTIEDLEPVVNKADLGGYLIN